MKFFKMHGLGNDYIFFDMQNSHKKIDWQNLASALSTRRLGIGSDGVVVLESSAKATVKMVMFNQDGTRGATCGNALRCVMQYIHYMQGKKFITIETDSGIRQARLISHHKNKYNTVVFMGRPKLLGVIKYKIGAKIVNLAKVDVGNRHIVVFVKSFGQNIMELGKKLCAQTDCNIQFVKIVDPKTLFVRVYERGSGETMACGSGAVACAYIAQRLGLVKFGTTKVMFENGSVWCQNQPEGMYLQGPTELVYIGEVDLAQFK